MIRRWIAAAILIGAVGACGPFCGNGKLNLSNAKLNPTSFTCPANVSDYGYDVAGSVDADNQTGKKVTIKSMATSATVAKLAGSWAIKVGDKSGSSNVGFSPKSVDAGAKATLKFTTPWSCTDTGNNKTETYADFKLVLTVVTDIGTYKIDLPNHRMRMA